MRRVLRGFLIGFAALALAGCGGSGSQDALEWSGEPYRYLDRTRGVLSLAGTVRNTTSDEVRLDPKKIRLLDADGRKVPAEVLVGAGGVTTIAPHGLGRVGARWTKGEPTRLDYGAGTLQLPPGL